MSRMITLDVAVALSIELWSELAKGGSVTKQEVLHSKQMDAVAAYCEGKEEPEGFCWLCEWTAQNNKVCNECPLAVCGRADSEFSKWAGATTIEERKEHARSLVKRLQNYVREESKK